jgi:hypothetical protein
VLTHTWISGGGGIQYILIFPGGKSRYILIFSGRKTEYILIFPGRKMSIGEKWVCNNGTIFFKCAPLTWNPGSAPACISVIWYCLHVVALFCYCRIKHSEGETSVLISLFLVFTVMTIYFSGFLLKSFCFCFLDPTDLESNAKEGIC